MHANKTDEPALLGVFARTSYITFGTQEKPLDYGGKVEHVRECYKGKQIGIIAPHTGKTVDVYFEKKHNWISDGEKYVDKWRYAELQKEKKKGFGTSDFSKRDEFSNTVRTLQWREQLEHEAKWTRQAIEFFNEAAQQTEGAGGGAASARGREHNGPALYDLVYEKAPGREAPACSKVHRDTHNPTALSHDRALGGRLTIARLHFQAPGQLSKPEFARRPLIRDTFFRRTNVAFPADCDAAGGQ